MNNDTFDDAFAHYGHIFDLGLADGQCGRKDHFDASWDDIELETYNEGYAEGSLCYALTINNHLALILGEDLT